MRHTRQAPTDLGPGGWPSPWTGSSGSARGDVKLLDEQRVAVQQSDGENGASVVWSARAVVEFVTGAKASSADFLLT
ncbi:DUF397 domain-containing protein [Streptomyces sp. BH-SS-21]|uniref:DUF397 domain-containing protein n=1 Tax=Streptomyces liliiviolaceus TaxID=2823109 RepID=A0A941B9R9_9ACTN|nr:DUF397 domain-containing protein [Streptomyces liliiviolaceus]MBQ0850363.1 DUF397 domain-containing protein [Streptomyces liliiviolaceus]